jgi:hypothetical protein
MGMFHSDGKFQAHSGRTVRVGDDGTVMFDKANGYLSPESAMDAEEFFQAKRDRELGRWRDPLNPDYVVYLVPSDDMVRVLDERDGMQITALRADVRGFEPSGSTRGLFKVAWNFFDAHPVRQPWDDAKPGEIWAVSVEGQEMFAVHAVAGFLGEVVFKSVEGTNVNMRSSAYTVARKIWPEDAS